MIKTRNFMNKIFSFIIGVAAGTALGILLAPASGRDTRKKIIEEADKLIEDALEYKRKMINKAVEETVA